MSPRRAAHVCSYPGCPAIVQGAEHYCPQHKRAYDQQRGTAVERGYGSAWRRIRAAFLAKHPLCWCGQPATDVDHIVAKRAGGTDDWSNLQALCHAHHSLKTATVDSTFAHREGA
jgi:5-methylcytosine-specific restriction enzyme A